MIPRPKLGAIIKQQLGEICMSLLDRPQKWCLIVASYKALSILQPRSDVILLWKGCVLLQ